MRKHLNKILSIVMLMVLAAVSPAFSQEAETDMMRSEGKIYVVVVIAFVVLTIMTLYMIRIDRKVSKLEKEQKH